jgi:hypothetical protein
MEPLLLPSKDTHARGPLLRVSDEAEEFQAFDALPKPICEALRTATLKWSAIDVLSAYTSASEWADNPTRCILAEIERLDPK